MKPHRQSSRLLLPILCLSACCALSACQENGPDSASSSTSSFENLAASNAVTTQAETKVPVLTDLVAYRPEDTDDTISSDSVTNIVVSGTNADITGNGAALHGNTLTVSSAGTYCLSGSFSGSVRVNAPKDAVVRLALNGVSIQSGDGPAICIDQCDKAVIVLTAGSDNTLTDSASYTLDAGSDEPDAALYSKNDLTIVGGGTLRVNASYKDAIKCKDDLLLLGGSLTLNAADDGVTGRDMLVLDGASVEIQCENDGLKTTNDETEEKGQLILNSGTLTIRCGGDGVQSASKLYLLGGDVDITAGGGAAEITHAQEQKPGDWMGMGTASQADDASSTKGLKAARQLTIGNGKIAISSYDDALHSNGHILISGGELSLATGDDGAHADGSLAVTGGVLQITQSYEGLEAADIQISGGEIRVRSSDDGVNASDGSTSLGMGGPMAQGSSSNVSLTISGGWLSVDADGDGLDSNGSITMTGGTVLVNGPTSGGNGALDYDASMNVNGGILVAAGSVGMAEPPSSTSQQNVIVYTWSTAQPAGTLFTLSDAEGNVLMSYAPTKQYQWIAVSLPALESGQTVVFSSGGSCNAQSTDGWYGNADVQGQQELAQAVLTERITSSGASGAVTAPGGGMGGGPGGGMGGNRPMR